MSRAKVTRSADDRATTALRGAGDLCDAIRFFVDRDLPDSVAGADECAQLIRDLDEGDRSLWAVDGYLQQITFAARALVYAAYQRERVVIAQSFVRDLGDDELRRFLRSVLTEARGRQQPKQTT